MKRFGPTRRESEANFRSFVSAMNNGRGRQHEAAIEGACRYYHDTGRANIIKVPEPFRVQNKITPTQAYVRFTAHAQPDYIGALKGGRLIAFEAKTTSTDQLKQDVVTPTQAKALEDFTRLGAITGVCASIQDANFFIPWSVFSHMKENFGRKYVMAKELDYYRVRFNGCVMFLDYQSGRDRQKISTVEQEFRKD